MLETPLNEVDNYGGSRTFTWLADLSGLSIDVVNFIICQISAIFLASLFRSVLHPSKVASSVRHIVALSIGLVFGYFCFGPQAIHIAGLPAACYVVIRTQSPKVVQRGVMIVAMAYLLTIHLLRQIYDDGSHTLDITGPLMIITQKVTSLAFSIHDGFVRQTKDLTKAQQYHAVSKLPSALEYFSYALHFQGLMAGPLVFYKDYIDFVEGCNLLKPTNTNGSVDNGKTQLVLEPSPVKTVVKKVIGSFICAFIFMKFIKMYPIKNMKDDDFINNTSIVYKIWYAMMATTCTRFKYYHAWLLADAICNNSGLGFTGYDKDGNANWDLISNINVLGFEFATNMRDAINNWNCGTNRWLRTIVYERVPKKYGTILTFALSAVWHGFYPGYYLTFATGALMVTSARMARRMFRHRFQQTRMTRMLYDILTCLTTRIVMGYATFPFVLLEFMGSIRLYLKFYLCLHIVALITIFVLPKFIRGERRPHPPQSSSKTSLGGEQEKPLILNNIKKNDRDEVKESENDKTAIKAAANVNTSYSTTNTNELPEAEQRHTPPVPPKLPLVNPGRDAVSVPHDQCEMDQLSSKIKEKIEAETKNIEEFIDKTVTETVTGIVEFKNDLMREIPNGLRKRTSLATTVSDVVAGATGKPSPDESAAFLKKEIEVINAVVQQANVLPAVLSNGHAK
ncbi:lysophospholipid acyltransferase 6 isoform X1 [Lucilia cuprina]|uniref:lysophospholipid acyltransferase 6 isoform X1 n=2 Tax=Lucilia cuprina TaxID=7375 RepID=UPI001F06B9AA|nr:lysophospholipid acyltransferase 6 isoform X1 [Lucilia cuprina]XP_046810199.1 lysophospholipid acyltransferase 6 isoform X1 [Lucilia cuprina]